MSATPDPTGGRPIAGLLGRNVVTANTVAGVLLAELEIRHSRAIAPTRRVALGELFLPVEPAPGFGGILLAGIVASRAAELDIEAKAELDVLIDDLESGRHVSQPRLRYRFQADVHGLDRSRHRLVGDPESFAFELDGHGHPLPQVLAASYAASRLTYKARPEVFRLLWRATRWEHGDDPRLPRWLMGDDAALRVRPDLGGIEWARAMLGFDRNLDPGRTEVLRRFRQLVRDAHPDHGADTDGAGERISELSEAKRVLLGA